MTSDQRLEIRIPAELAEEARIAAALNGMTLSEYVRESIRFKTHSKTLDELAGKKN